MILRRKGRRLPGLTAILLSLGMVVGTTGTNVKAAHAEVTEQLEEQMKEQKESVSDGNENAESAGNRKNEESDVTSALALKKETGTGTENEIDNKEADRIETSREETSKEETSKEETSKEETSKEETSKEETSKKETSKEETNREEINSKTNSKTNSRENDDAEQETDDGDELLLITGFEKLDVSVYEFDEKPELDVLLKSFPKTLEATIEKEVLVASVSDASEIMTEDIDVFWECDDDYEESDLDEYIFYPVPDLIGCEVIADEVPVISVILTDAEKETELKSEIEDIKGSRTDSETIDLTANVDGMEVTVSAQAGVLPEDAILKVRKVENRRRIEEMQEAIENHMEEQDQGTTVEDMVVFDVSLWDSEGNEIQPDTTKGEIVVSFRNLGLTENAVLEELEIYHFEDAAGTQVMKEEAVVEDEAVVCSVDHFSEYAVVKLMAAQTAGAVAQIGNDRYETFESALTNATDGETICLLDNVTVTERVYIDKSVTIELNNKELTYNGQYSGFNVKQGNHTVVFQNGTVKGGICAGSGASLIINHCQIEAGNIYAIWGNGAKKLQICDSAVAATGTDHALYAYGMSSSANESVVLERSSFVNDGSAGHSVYFFGKAGQVTIDNCSISADSSSNKNGYGLYVYGLNAGDSITVRDTEISTVNEYAVFISWDQDENAAISFENGNTIKGQVKIAGNVEHPNYQISISGGKFESDPPFVHALGNTTELLKRLNLTGGEFKVDVTQYTANGYACVNNANAADGYDYVVVQANGSGPVYVLNDSGKQYYEDLETALDQTKLSGEIIYVEADAVINNPVKLSGRVLTGAGTGKMIYNGLLSTFLTESEGAELNGINLVCSDIEVISACSADGKLTAGTGFTEENYAAYGALLAEGYLMDAVSYVIKPESDFTAKVGYLGGLTLDNALRAAARNDSEASQVNDEIILLRDTSGRIYIDKPYTTLTVDLNGHTINNNKSMSQGVWIDSTANHANITLKNGTVYGKEFGIVTNGQSGDVALNLDEVDISADIYGMYLPAEGKTIISGGTITGGQTGIEIRGGILIIDGAAITGKGEFSEQPNAGGSTTMGVGIAVVQHTTKHPIDVTLSECNISGTENAVRQSDLQENKLDNVKVTILSGSYHAKEGNAVYSENLTKFITGGTYSSEPAESYIADEYVAIKNANTFYTVRKKAAEGGLQDGDASIQVEHEVISEPQKPEAIAGDMETIFDAAAEAAKNSVMAISANAAVAGNAAAVCDLAKAVEENEILELNVQTKVSLEQRLTASEFETIVQTGADGETTGVQVLPKSLTFEVNAYIVHLDKDQNELPDTIQQIDLSSSRMTNRVPFTFRFPVPSEVTALYANVEHEGDPVMQYAIEGSGAAKYITVSVWHLSQFKLTFTNELMTNQGGSNTGNGNSNTGNGNSGSGNGNNGSGDSGSDTAGSGGSWIQDAVGWWFRRYDGTYPKAQWYECIWNDRTDWYHFNAAGYMDEGWFVDTDGKIYFLHNISDNTRGHMYTGWHLIDGKWYYFNPSAGAPKGALLTNATTPDGYTVNEKGEWIQ